MARILRVNEYTLSMLFYVSNVERRIKREKEREKVRYIQIWEGSYRSSSRGASGYLMGFPPVVQCCLLL